MALSSLMVSMFIRMDTDDVWIPSAGLANFARQLHRIRSIMQGISCRLHMCAHIEQ